MINNNKRKELDKFYTKENVAKKVWGEYKKILKNWDYDIIVEPSAGNGALLSQIETYKSVGLDLLPENKNIIQNDFLGGQWIENNLSNKKIAFFGNPPFGKRASLAIKFINKCFDFSDLVGMILPNQFKKYSAHSKIRKDAKLIFEIDLPRNSFTFGDKDYNVNCVFQVWTTKIEYPFKNIRLSHKPSITSEDFEIYQYNATKGALKFFDCDWDFALLRQGYGDFNKIYTKKDELSTKKQWMFLKVKNNIVLKRLKKIDFNTLSELNTSASKGFGKADLVKAYNTIKKLEIDKR